MKKSLGLLSLLLTLSGCLSFDHAPSKSELKSQASTIVADMTLREQLGQLIMLDFRHWQADGSLKREAVEEINPEISQIIWDYQLGGVILFRENIQNLSKTVQLINNLQTAGAKQPLFIGVDQEGGYITRLKFGTDFPGNMALGAANDPALTEQVGQAIGNELAALGINFNFAPVIDVNSNQNNPVIGIRSFGDNPQRVAEMGVAYINGQKSAGVISSVKHFPGHGNTASDSHLGLATVNYGKQTWQNLDRVPFEAAIDAGVEAIMTAHVTFPALDDTQVKSRKTGEQIGLPATLSKQILTGILRETMDFDGLIITDALNMQAIAQHFGKSDAVIRSLKAGADILLMPEIIRSKADRRKLDALFSEVLNAAENDPTLRQRITESAERVIYLKLQKKLTHSPKDPGTAAQIVKSKAHQQLEKMAAEKAITLLKNDHSPLPFELKEHLDILLISDTNARLKMMTDEMETIVNETNLQGLKLHPLKLDYNTAISDEIMKEIVACDYIILTTYNLTPAKSLPKFIAKFAILAKKPLVSIATRNPYDLIHNPYSPAYLACYGITGFDQTNSARNSLEINLKSAIRSLFSHPAYPQLFNTPTGKLPVNIQR